MKALGLLACVILTLILAPSVRADDAIKLVHQTQHYRLVLQVGPSETMYTAAEAKAKHPISGEIMLSGKMAGGMPGMDHAMPGMMTMSDLRHVELHVSARDSGKPVTDARVSITLTGDDKKRRALPIARMYGAVEGLDDLHYGNNMALASGAYTVDAAVNGESARFSVTVSSGP
ncbi:MAG TPA: hypothetical protein VN823_01155 [Stellaceae bacterium]|nr:hypothetical protein [Stellaceae bacterium]